MKKEKFYEKLNRGRKYFIPFQKQLNLGGRYGN